MPASTDTTPGGFEGLDLLSLPRIALTQAFLAAGEKSFRAEQLFRWLHVRLVRDLGLMTDLPAALRERFVGQYGLSGYDATTLTGSRASAEYFLAVVDALEARAPGAAEDAVRARAKVAANWVVGDLAAALNRDGIEAAASPVTPAQMATLIARIQDGTISGKIAREVFQSMWAQPSGEPQAPDRIIDARGLRQISDASAIDPIIDQVLAANPKSVEEFRAGKDKAFNALVGQVMKATKGKANPQQVNDALRRKLAG